MAVITAVAYMDTPKNWAQCSGQLLAISTNQALFSLLGTVYGGNGINNFALPDLRSRTGVGTGISQAGGGTVYNLGQLSGTTTAFMGINNMPAHSHNGAVTLSLGAINRAGREASPKDNYMGSGVANSFSTNSNTPMANLLSAQATIENAGGSQPFSVQSPYLAINHIICMAGVYPSRS